MSTSQRRGMMYVAAMLMLGLCLPGCAGKKTAPDTANFVTYISARPQPVTEVALGIVTDMGLKDIRSGANAGDGYVLAKNTDGRTLRIDVRKIGANVSEVSVRVGRLGDEALSQDIIKRIDKDFTKDDTGLSPAQRRGII